jgi:hypothetical protein
VVAVSAVGVRAWWPTSDDRPAVAATDAAHPAAPSCWGPDRAASGQLAQTDEDEATALDPTPRDQGEARLHATDANLSTVFLGVRATSDDRARIERLLMASPAVEWFCFRSKATAYQRFVAVFADAPDLIEATDPESLPESYVIRIGSPGDAPALEDTLRTLPGVDSVVTHR